MSQQYEYELRQRAPYEAWLVNESSPERRGLVWLRAVMRPTGAQHIAEIPLLALQAIYSCFTLGIDRDGFEKPVGNGIVIY